MHDYVPPEEMRELRIAAASLANESLAIAGGLMPTFENAAHWQDFWLARLLGRQATSIFLALTVTDSRGRVKYQFSSNGGAMTAAAFTMDDTCTLSATPEDDHGDPTGDSLSFAASDAGAVLTLAPSGNTCLLTPVAEGTSTIMVSDPSSPGVTSWEVDVTVGPGATSQIQGTVTVNTGANAVPPPA